MTLTIGIDFDNTLAGYDAAFAAAAAARGWVEAGFVGGKTEVRARVRALDDGERRWMELQGRVYGAHMAEATPMPGALDFLRRARAAGHRLVLISHKTRHGHFDPERIDLHQAALDWIATQGFAVELAEVHFEDSREAKLARIAAIGCDHFIDDLPEVLSAPGFPATTQRWLYASGDTLDGPWRQVHSFDELAQSLLGEDDSWVCRRAEDMLERPCLVARRGGTGGNNRLFRVETADGPVAVKCYPRLSDDPRDRQGTEFCALTFLFRHGENSVPRPLGRGDGVAAYEWIEGIPATASTDTIDQMAAFAARLWALRTVEDARHLPNASEACVTADAVERQVRTRLKRLAAIKNPALVRFLAEDFTPLVEQAAARRRDAMLPPPEHLTLSPSDFGLHNALVRANGHLVFVDFEYFGWDDPVKLTADVLLHPGMALSAPLREHFHAQAARIWGTPAFHNRLEAQFPLYALRWAAICLNEFLPERWARRALAGGGERERILSGQLAKAQAFCRRAEDTLRSFTP